ncbi:MAG: EAL domain-containing protein [Nocardioidaceae bacterium]|nr:EAL domain-containing protein [Nocardioidaceae bacterium]
MDVRRALAGPAVIAVTALILLAEFGLLTWVYHLNDDVDAQVLAHSRAEVAARAWSPGSTTADVLREAQRLATSGAPGADQVLDDARAWSSSPTAAGLQAVTANLDAVGETVAADQRRTDLEVSAILVTLLVVVSIGWFLWFRRLVARHRDLQQRLTRQQVVEDEQRRLTALVSSSADVIAILDASSAVQFVSPAVTTVLGTDPESLTGTRLVDRVTPADQLVLSQLLTGSRPGRQALTLRMIHRDGRELIVEGTLEDLTGDATVDGFVLTARDVTQRHQLQDDLVHQAFHDALTGLANRQLFGDRLSHALARRVNGLVRPLAVLFLDLDDFKDINDSLGHAAGDLLLTAVAERITGAIGSADTAARLGGDEFAILLEDADLNQATQVAERLLAALAAPVTVDHHHHVVSGSIGIAQALPGRIDGDEVMRNADVAMYMAKDRGKGGVAVYDSTWHHRALEVLEMRNDLQWAIEAGELTLHYQPTVDLRTQAITGFEALVRWQHPERGLIPPLAFIPIAEQSGLIIPLGRWVLNHACRAAVRLQATTGATTMAVNVSAQQLARADFVDDVLDALATSGLSPVSLVLEITESTLLADLNTTVATLTRLRGHGIRVAIDDFGTGYSSLSHLATLPIDVLKVDKSFVDDLDAVDGSSLIKAILAMSDSMDLVTVAEGVEHGSQARWLRGSTCTLGQGYLWSRPVEFDAAEQLLRTGVDQQLGVEPAQSRTLRVV